ncbi:TadA family conjugal transfer-associated ATPase [Paeniglutamicibacter sp. ABSL32-1]|uniref:TadA family conjugal transfer-associated ATPase n=1 Tax=Paeniglutamicibacter quisquiliarum TaxID=2849498 RepID=UPI001C2D5BB8|nr:TadA family conjugal transfer-associated ATPase [Paeniglutamicibacter quisquiliarum]MBV1780667.1 TadA family conjugal transfer-associated ATPase [Paeniglutamicibacter quisquiliarum]
MSGPEQSPGPLPGNVRRGRRRWEARPPARAQEPAAPARVLEEVRLRAMGQGGGLSEVDLASAVRASGRVMGAASSTEMLRSLSDDIHGLGILERLAQVPGTTDILIDAGGQVWVDGSAGLHAAELAFTNPEQIRALAVRLAAAGGRRLDDAQPFVDVSLGNYRIHAVLPPISTGGPLLSIRIKGNRNQRLERLVDDPGWLAALGAIVAAKLNFLVSGGTGAGKTTLLAAMLARVPGDERIIVVEDSQELAPAHPHLVGLQSRGGNVEGAGEIGMDTLVRQALRMRPDRLVVGECRGAEVREFLGAMNTGHEGAAGTVHANSVTAVPARLAAMGALASMDAAATALQAASALDVLIHVWRDPATGVRRPVQLGRVVLTEAGMLSVRMIRETGTGDGDPEALDWFRTRLKAAGEESPW